MATPSGLVSTAIGAAGGVIEVVIQQPLVYLKNTMQRGAAPSLNPRVMYRGVPISAMMMAPITAVQFGATSVLSRALQGGTARPLSDLERLTCTATAGALSAVLYCPADLVVLHQQKTGFSLSKQYSTIVREHGRFKLYKGFLPTVGRESLFTAGYLGLGPILKDKCHDLMPGRFGTREDAAVSGGLKAKLASSVAAGIFAGYASHPVDTIKTRMQNDLSATSAYPSMRATAAKLWAEGGLPIFFKGVVPRTVRFIGSVLIYNETNSRLSVLARSNGYT